MTLQEWNLHNDEMIINIMKQMNSTKVLRQYIDGILKEIVENLIAQKNITNEAFKKRIAETKEVKAALEHQHSEVQNYYFFSFIEQIF